MSALSLLRIIFASIFHILDEMFNLLFLMFRCCVKKSLYLLSPNQQKQLLFQRIISST